MASALNGKAATILTLQAQQQAGNINILYQLEGKPAQGQLVLALVQKHAVSNIKAGENEGKTLEHAQIVRQFGQFPIKQQGMGNESLTLLKGFDASNSEVIGFIQSPETGEILAAGRTSISSTSSKL